MAEKDEDKQVIVIEDLDEDEQKEEDESLEREQEQEEESDGDVEEKEGDEGAEDELPSSQPFLKKKKNLIIIGLAGLLIVIIAIILIGVVFSKKEAPKVEKKQKEHVVEKKIEHKKPKKEKRPTKYNPMVDAHFINALRLQEAGDYEAAIKELKRASVDLYLAYYSIGYIYLKLGDVKKAKEYLIDKTKKYLILTIENNPNYILGYINLFRIYMSQKEYTKAKQVLDVLKDKKVSKRELALMEAYYDFVVNKKQIKLYDLLDKYPNAPILNGLMGSMYLEEGNLKDAEFFLDRAIKPYVIGTLCYNKALIYAAKKEYKKAMRCISKSYYMDFNKIVCKNYLAFFVFLHQKKLKAAYDFFQLNRRYNKECYSHFKITPMLSYSISKSDYVARKSINYMLAAEVLNMYLKPIKFELDKNRVGIKLGDLYESLGLLAKAKESYEKTAVSAEIVLLTQKALKFYAMGNLKSALLYYKKALSKMNTNPILLYNVAIMYLKNHDLDKANSIFKQLSNAYPNFPLPHVGMFIVKQIYGEHKNAMKEIKKFLIKFRSISSEKIEKNMADLGVFAYFVADKRLDEKRFRQLKSEDKHLFLLIKAAMNGNLSFLSIEKEFERMINLDIDTTNYTTVMEYFDKTYKNNVFIKRTLADCYLFDKKYEKAYRAMFGIPQYSAEDYYKLGISYLMSGYPEVADNFFTKSILKGVDISNSYMAKAIIQAQKGDLKGVAYYLKILLKKGMVWFNTYIFLSFDLELR